MLFYSEITGKLYKTEDELNQDETIEKNKLEAVNAKKAELQELYKAYVKARDAYVKKKKEYDMDVTEWYITI